jgi:hypothetical protein
MSDTLDNLVRTVEREARLLAGLPAVQPAPECLARVRAAVLAEAERLGSRPRRTRVAPPWLASAAALLLAVGLSGVLRHSTPWFGAGTMDTDLVAVWVDAVDESRETLAALLDEGWMVSASGADVDYDSQIDDILDGFKEFFGPFETL